MQEGIEQTDGDGREIESNSEKSACGEQHIGPMRVRRILVRYDNKGRPIYATERYCVACGNLVQ